MKNILILSISVWMIILSISKASAFPDVDSAADLEDLGYTVDGNTYYKYDNNPDPEITYDNITGYLDYDLSSSLMKTVAAANAELYLKNSNDFSHTDDSVSFLQIGTYGAISESTAEVQNDGDIDSVSSVVALSVTGSINNTSSITNNGTISSTSSSDAVIDSYAGGGTDTSLAITNTGTMTSSSALVLEATTADSDNQTISIINSGTMTSTDSAVMQVTTAIGTSETISITNSGTITSSSNSENVINITSTGNADVTLTNSGTIHAGDGTGISDGDGAFAVSASSVNSFILNNSGTISNDGAEGLSDAVIFIAMATDSSSAPIITNSGIISAGSDTAFAIYNTGESQSLTLNIEEGSSITGYIASYIDGNVLNINTALNLTELNTLTAQLIGSWTTNLSDDSVFTISDGDTVDDITTSGAITNSGTVTTLTSNGGTINNTGTIGSMTVSGSNNTLVFASGSSLGNVTLSDSSSDLAIDTDSNISYSGVISGDGTIVKTGTAVLEITEDQTYAGATTVSEGELKVNATLVSDVTVSDGATISGSGTVGDLVVDSGGTLAPGNSPGTLNVAGNITLSSGSTSNFEFTDAGVTDQTIATGNIIIGSGVDLNLSLYGGNSEGYFITSGDILETTGGTISGTYDNVTTEDGYATSITYSDTIVNAVIATKLNSNVLDGVLSAQNLLTRNVSNSVSDELYSASKYFEGEIHPFVNYNKFSSQNSGNNGSADFDTTGSIASLGLAKSYGDYQFIAGFFNSDSKVSRYTYEGADQIQTNGAFVGWGKVVKLKGGDLSTNLQVGFAKYNSDSQRSVTINGVSDEGAADNVNGEFYYAKLAVKKDYNFNELGKIGIFGSALIQETKRDGWQETGLSLGNLSVSNSSARYKTYEIGTLYSNDFSTKLKLPKGASYAFGLSAYKSYISNQNDASVNQANTSYEIGYGYKPDVTYKGSAVINLPISEVIILSLKAERNKSDSYQETLGAFNLNFLF